MKRDEFLNKINGEIKAGIAKARPDIYKMGGDVYDHVFISYEQSDAGIGNDCIGFDSVPDDFSDLEETKNDKR